MPSIVDIANLALSHIGDIATVADLDPPDGSEQAEHCARFYPIARSALLERHAWGFTSRREQLPQLATGAVGPWSYAYALPQDAVNVLGVFDKDAWDDADPKPYVLQAGDTHTILLTNEVDPFVRFTVDGTDPTRYSPLFVVALSHLLASMLAGPVLRGETGRKVAKEQMQMAEAFLAKAAASDANQQRNMPPHRVPWIQDRMQPPMTLPMTWPWPGSTEIR